MYSAFSGASGLARFSRFLLVSTLVLVGLLFESWEPVVWLVVGEIAEYSGFFPEQWTKFIEHLYGCFFPMGF